MTVKIGDKLPEGYLLELTATGLTKSTISDIFSGKKIVLIALPGAFTPTCSAKHLPGFIANLEDIKNKGVDEILCLSVNDPFVMAAWGKVSNADGIRMVADADISFTESLGMTTDASRGGMGIRSRRYSMLVDDGVVTLFNLEQPGSFEVSDADTLLGQL